MERLWQLQQRRARLTGDQTAPLPLEYVVNVLVNRDLAHGKHGPAVAAFLARMGADASLVRQSDEDWVVVFNPQIIQRWERVPPNADVWDLPRIER